ncbi:MAG: hypothetical protein JRE43_04045 [Deltaproteobacteria bacterium]|jgi:hypothetical protein|nr:hypothetical protein [Deltaproteobacteria bacterium]MBW2542524.1 hypothetical protein [Deltaproteobacteria bacterium]
MPNQSRDPNRPAASDASIGSLDFERAETSANSAPVCAQCATPITDRYYTIGSHVLCEPCHFAFQSAKAPGNAASRFFGAAGLGTLAAAVGCGLWMAVTRLTGYEIGLIAIAVGFLVGMAVQIGSRRVGGLAYQLLAVFLTYSAIVMTYVPSLANEMIASEDFRRGLAAGETERLEEGENADSTADPVEGEPPNDPALSPEEVALLAWIAAIPIAYMLPFLMGFENAIGILIIGIALWQAYRMNARAKLEMQGPFRLGARDTAVG